MDNSGGYIFNNVAQNKPKLKDYVRLAEAFNEM